jgi:hypothetical protein
MSSCTALTVAGLALVAPASAVIVFDRDRERVSRWFVYAAGILGVVIVAIGTGRCD